MKKRIKWIDVAKGICMIAIVIGHLGDKQINRIVYSFHLPVLFILSGYTLKEQDIDHDFLNKKFNRLMLPYFTTCILICLGDIFNSFLNKDYAISTITNIIFKDLQRSWMASGSIKNIGSYSFSSRIGAIWFLPALFFALVITQIVLKHVKEWNHRFFVGCLLALAANAMRYFLWLPFSLLSGIFASVYILFGKWLKEKSILETLENEHIYLCLIVVVIAFLMDKSRLYMVSVSMSDYIITPLCSVASSFLVIKISMLLENSTFLQWIGRNSILVLQIHLLELEVGSQWYKKIIHDNNLFMWLLAWLSTIIICLLINEIIKKPEKLPQRTQKADKNPLQKRDKTIDLYKGLLIILMIIGYSNIDSGLRNIIYSIHMFAFVFLSGYFFHTNGGIKENIRKLVKGILKPYLFFCIMYFFFGTGILKERIISAVMGMSFSQNLFVNVKSIGPVYFILMLFCVRLVFILIDHFTKNEIQRLISVISLSLLGYYLGKEGYWLPWSFDCALYCLVFYYFGYLFKRYHLLETINKNTVLYFPLSTIWAFSLYYGALELATREYLDYGFYIIGSLAGILLGYLLCTLMASHISDKLNKAFSFVGQSTVYVLIVHKMFGGRISLLVETVMSLNRNNIPHLVVACAVQIFMGVLLAIVVGNVENLVGKMKQS